MDRIEDTNRQRLCACGSGKKWKRCHNIIDAERERLTQIEWRERMKRDYQSETKARDERLESYRKPGKAHLSAVLAMLATAGSVTK
jgi:hypothetical protein